MLSLRNTQEKFIEAMLGNGDASSLIIGGWLHPDQRMAIYRHHYKASLCEVLATSFSVVMRLVGPAFFEGMTNIYTAHCRPTRPCLAEYGAEFPAFISGFAPAQSLPYLSDVALFEWMMVDALQATHYEGNAFYSKYPVGRIWETNQEEYQGDDVIDLDEGGGWFVVEKKEGKVRWRWLDLPADTFQQEAQK